MQLPLPLEQRRALGATLSFLPSSAYPRFCLISDIFLFWETPHQPWILIHDRDYAGYTFPRSSSLKANVFTEAFQMHAKRT